MSKDIVENSWRKPWLCDIPDSRAQRGALEAEVQLCPWEVQLPEKGARLQKLHSGKVRAVPGPLFGAQGQKAEVDHTAWRPGAAVARPKRPSAIPSGKCATKFYNCAQIDFLLKAIFYSVQKQLVVIYLKMSRLFMPFHMVWFLLVVLDFETTFWLVKIFWVPIKTFYSVVFVAAT